MKNKCLTIFLAAVALSLSTQSVFAAEPVFKPFMQGGNFSGNMSKVSADVEEKLIAEGFEIVGKYSPYDDSLIIVVTNDTLKSVASNSENGGFGAMQRVSLTTINKTIQVSYTNPTYMFHVYRMKGNLDSIVMDLKNALGSNGEFGPTKGLDEKSLRKYHYKVLMPYFDDITVIAEYNNYNEAIRNVESGLAAGNGGTSKVYRIDIPGKEETVFGVALTIQEEAGSDYTVMEEIDFKPVRSTAHLPYEILVTGKKVIIFDGKFRIAINFPDLSMIGDHSFMNIVGAPGNIEESLKAAAKGK
jgi:hypothetical protein